MLALNGHQKIFLYGRPCDMRKGFNGLYGLVENSMQLDPLCGYLFVFINGGRTHVKILCWDFDGLVLYYKRLEKGTFRRPSARLNSPNSELSHQELYMILRGIDFEKTKKRKRFLSSRIVD